MDFFSPEDASRNFGLKENQSQKLARSGSDGLSEPLPAALSLQPPGI